MTRHGWFLHFLKKSLGQRKGRVAVASVSVMIAAAVLVAALGLSLGIRQKLGGELKFYGANVMIVPREGFMSDGVLAKLAKERGVESYAAQVYSPVTLKDASVEMIGLELDKARGLGWRLQGKWPEGRGILVGVDVSKALDVEPGDTVDLGVGEMEEKLEVTGFVETGGPEDMSVIMDLPAAQSLAGMEGKIGAVLVRVKSEGLRETVRSIRGRLPGVEVKTLRQVAHAEESFLSKIELLMLLVTVVVLVASSISVSSTMSATVLERLKELGLMKAIGGTRREIGSFYLAEGLVIGLVGGLAGCMLGYISAQVVSVGAFGSFISVPAYVFPIAIALGMLISILACHVPLAEALRYRPSVILRGE